RGRRGRPIRVVNEDEGLLVANNLLCGPPPRIESPSRIRLLNNLAADLTSALVAPAEGNLRLTPRATQAIHHATPLPEVKDDIDRKPRGPQPDIGAHQL